jgi:hypothetical protein
MYEIFAQNPVRGAKFGMLFSRADEPHTMLLDNYTWTNVQTFVDVGGSHGSVAIGLANQFPQIKCVVQDLLDTVVEGISRLPADLEGKVTFMAQ